MTNDKTKLSFKNVLIFILAILSMFLTTLYAPNLIRKSHQRIIAHAENSTTITIKFKDTLTSIGEKSFSINFGYNGNSFTSFSTYYENNIFEIYYSSTRVYYGQWINWNGDPKYITLDTNQTNFNAFITAMKDNIDGVLLESGTYKWVDKPHGGAVYYYTTLDFSSNNESYTVIKINNSIETIDYINSSNTKHVFSFPNTWSNDAYKTITTTTDQYIDYDFYNYAILGNQLVKQDPTPTYYSVSYALLNNCTADSNNPTQVASGVSYDFKFNIINTDYDVTFVTIGNATLVTYSTTNGIITATINNVVGNVSIEVSVATPNTFYVTYTFNDGVIGNDGLPSTIKTGQTITGSVTTQSGYIFDSVTCSNGDFTFDYNSSQTQVDFTLKDVTANVEITFTAKIPSGGIIADYYKSTLTNGVLPLNNNIGYVVNNVYTINATFELFDGFNSFTCNSFTMIFQEIDSKTYCTAYFLNNSQMYNLFDSNYNWSNNYLKYVILKNNVSTSKVAANGFNYIFNTIYSNHMLSSGTYTFKSNNDYYSSSFELNIPFVYWVGTSFNSNTQSKIVVKNGLYYYSSLNVETIVYGANTYINNNARCIKILQSTSLKPYVYDSLLSMLDIGNQIGFYIGGSYTFTFENLNDKDTSEFTSFNFQYFKDNYYSQNISVKGFKVTNSNLYYILFDNSELLVYNGSWVEEYYRYISIVYQNVDDSQLEYLNANGVFQNLYHGDNVTTWQQFFFTIADVPLYIFSRIFYFELFGEQTFIIIYSIVTILIVFKIVSWALKLKD